MPIHWNDLWSPRASPNEATTDQVDPMSKEPALEVCAVAISPAEIPSIRPATSPRAYSICLKSRKWYFRIAAGK